MGSAKNGWITLNGAVGYFDGDDVFRAATALHGLGANRPEDAVYSIGNEDGDGKPLSGANRYRLQFAKGETPPVTGFWSITMYDEKGFPVVNRINRRAICDRDKLKVDADGSTDIYIQRDNPGADNESNWLPAPEGPSHWPSGAVRQVPRARQASDRRRR